MEEVQHSLQKRVYRFILIAFIVLLALPGRFVVQAENTENTDVTVGEWLQQQQKEEAAKQPDNEETEVTTEENNLEGNEEIPTFESAFTWWDIVKMIGAFFIVIALIYLLLRFINQRNRFVNEGKLMQNIGGIGLGANKSIQLVRIGERIYVVGVGENISLLKEIDDEEEVADMLEANEIKGLTNAATGIKKFFSISQQQEKNEQESFQAVLKKQLDAFAEGRKQTYEKFNKEDKS